MASASGGARIRSPCSEGHHRCEWQHLCIDAGDVPGWRFGPEGGRFVALTRISQWANCRNTFKANPKPRTGGQSAAGPELAGDEAAYTGPATIPDSPPLGNRDGTRSAAPEAAVGNGAAVDWDDDGHAVDADTRSLTARLDLPITTLQVIALVGDCLPYFLVPLCCAAE